MGLTNDELAQAIEVADKKVRECGIGAPRHEPLLEHLKALLAEQRRRAVQPATVSLFIAGKFCGGNDCAGS